MTSKERAALRGQANGLDALFQVGKGGVTEAVIAQTDDALRAKELIKIKVLTETCPDTTREAADKLAAATGADVVQVIGGVMVKKKSALPPNSRRAKWVTKSDPCGNFVRIAANETDRHFRRNL